MRKVMRDSLHPAAGITIDRGADALLDVSGSAPTTHRALLTSVRDVQQLVQPAEVIWTPLHSLRASKLP